MGFEVSIQERKANLRRRLVDARRTVSPEQRHRDSDLIIHGLNSLSCYRQASLVCSYIGYGEEVETAGLVRNLLRDSRRVAVPTQRGDKGKPAFAEIRSWEELSPNSLGIMEPALPFVRLLPTDAIPLFLVPGVGFDTSGNRLGYGLGFYDRALAAASEDAVLIGLSFELQLVTEVPVTSHDKAMDLVITERRVIRTSPAAKSAKEVC